MQKAIINKREFIRCSLLPIQSDAKAEEDIGKGVNIGLMDKRKSVASNLSQTQR
ncbi:hypothetical protein J7L05_07960 [bacterium]|nr:hypothetical protein [bacterium]